MLPEIHKGVLQSKRLNSENNTNFPLISKSNDQSVIILLQENRKSTDNKPLMRLYVCKSKKLLPSFYMSESK